MTPSPRPRPSRVRQAAIQEARADPEVRPVWAAVRARCDRLWDSSGPPLTADDIGQLWGAIADLAHLIRQRGLTLADLWGASLEEELLAHFMDAYRPHGLALVAPGLPFMIAPDGGLHGWEEAKPAHLLQLPSYATSLRPPGQPGRPRTRPQQDQKSERPRIDPEKAARALQMKRDGKPWPAIAAALDLSYDPHDRRACKAMQERIRRWIERALVNEHKKVHDPRKRT
jgi:hypothetical protein